MAHWQAGEIKRKLDAKGVRALVDRLKVDLYTQIVGNDLAQVQTMPYPGSQYVLRYNNIMAQVQTMPYIPRIPVYCPCTSPIKLISPPAPPLAVLWRR